MFFFPCLESQKLSDKTQSTDDLRLEKSVENFIYILDGNLQISDVDKTNLIGLINFGLTFNDTNDKICIDFITQTVNEQLILILSRTSMENFDKNILNSSKIRSIYIVDDSKDYSNDYEKTQGIYTDMANVCNQLEKDMLLSTYDLTTILSIPANDISNSAFSYIQVLKDILLETDAKTDLRKDMLNFCYQVYSGNDIQLRYINEFERHFQPDEAIKWYLRQETFLFKMLTRAFRIPEPDVLYKLRFFIQHLYHQLKSNFSKTPTTVYRIQRISNNNFDLLLKNREGLLTFNQFLVTYKVKIRAKQLIDKLIFDHSKFKVVLFQIELGTKIPNMNPEKDSDELLINAAAIFRILKVGQIKTEIPVVKLTSNSEALKEIQKSTLSMREATHGSFPLLRIVKLMKQMEYMEEMEYFCVMLIDDPRVSNNKTMSLMVGDLFHTLFSYYYQQKEYDRAREQLERSFKIYSCVLPPDHIKLAATYNNMGSICHSQGLDEQAFQFQKKAYDIQVKSSNPDPSSIAAYAGNIASVLIQQGKYNEAIPFLQQDLQIRQGFCPNGDDINLAVKYHNLAGAQFKINKNVEALENYGKCLEIELKLHLPTHPTIAVTYYTMATVFESLGQLKEATQSIQKAIERLLLTRDERDEEVQMYKEYEICLRQKISDKSLLTRT